MIMKLKGKRVFVIEDDAMNLAIIRFILQNYGAAIYHEYWGVQTIEYIKRALPIDIILLDLMFPHGISGYDVYAQIRAVPELADIPVVAVSASDPAIEMNRARNLGFMGFIEKPVSQTTLPVYVDRVLSGTPVWAET
jgi:CheY-like chemotaxis protein